MVNAIRRADIFFTCQEGSLVTEGIQAFQRGGESCPYTHVAIVDEWPWIVSADAKGVVHREIKKEELYKFTVLTCPILTDEQRDAIIESALKDVERGVKYDFFSIGKLALHLPVEIDEQRMYCSEHVYVKYLKKGMPLLEREPVYVLPRDLYHAAVLREVGWR